MCVFWMLCHAKQGSLYPFCFLIWLLHLQKLFAFPEIEEEDEDLKAAVENGMMNGSGDAKPEPKVADIEDVIPPSSHVEEVPDKTK